MRNLIFISLLFFGLYSFANGYEPLDLGLNLPKLKVALKTVHFERDRIEILISIHNHLVKYISIEANKTNRTELYWTAIDNDSVITRMIDLGCQRASKNLQIELELSKTNKDLAETTSLEEKLHFIEEICR